MCFRSCSKSIFWSHGYRGRTSLLEFPALHFGLDHYGSWPFNLPVLNISQLQPARAHFSESLFVADSRKDVSSPSRHGRESPGSKVPGRIDGITAVVPESSPDPPQQQSDEHRLHAGFRLRVLGVADGPDAKEKEEGANHLEGRKSCSVTHKNKYMYTVAKCVVVSVFIG